MRALELTVYPRRGRETYVLPHPAHSLGASAVDRLSQQKRLTDAELAAEMFRQAAWLGAIKRTYATDEGRNVVIEAAFTFVPITRDEHEWLTVNRFATLPHYHERP